LMSSCRAIHSKKRRYITKYLNLTESTWGYGSDLKKETSKEYQAMIFTKVPGTEEGNKCPCIRNTYEDEGEVVQVATNKSKRQNPKNENQTPGRN